MEAWPIHAHLHFYTFRYANISSAEGSPPKTDALNSTEQKETKFSTSVHDPLSRRSCLLTHSYQLPNEWYMLRSCAPWTVQNSWVLKSEGVVLTLVCVHVHQVGMWEQHRQCIAFYHSERWNSTLTAVFSTWVAEKSKWNWSRKPLNMRHKCACYHQPSVYLKLPCFSVIWCQLGNLYQMLLLQLEGGVYVNFPCW